MGLKLINSEQYREIIVIDDSKLVIEGVGKKTKYKQHNLIRAFQRITREEKRFKEVEHYVTHLFVTLKCHNFITISVAISSPCGDIFHAH
jgi:hypothetical protein